MGGCQFRGIYMSMHPHMIVHPHTSIYPIHLYAPYLLYICMFSLYHMFPCVMGTWEHLYTPYVLGFWGASLHLSGISVSVSTSICPSVHNSYQLLPIIVGYFFTGLNAHGHCYASCCCSFLCSFSLSHELLLPWLLLLLLW